MESVRPIRYESGGDGGRTWESITRAPHAALRGHLVGAYEGYSEITHSVARRRHVPGTIIPIIINLGTALSLPDPFDDGAPAPAPQAFIAGLMERHAVTMSQGESRGIQVNFTPIGAHLFTGVPMHELAHRTLDLEQVLGAPATRLIANLHETEDWGVRFAMIEAFILRRLSHARAASPAVEWAWERLRETAGALSVNELSSEIGWSRKHLAARFNEQVGLPPKTVGRILRFGRVVDMIRPGATLPWTEVAARSGYYDQAHFIRDFHAFAGATPSEYLALQFEDGRGLADDHASRG
jgi:AraC-like DNA-binding protein